tara:strand:+ start:1295 stop:1732 length:438 start_codon:yes stop_codon:yes gene_type:complete
MTLTERSQYFDANLAKLNKELEPSTTEGIGKMLAVVTAVIGCPMPDQAVLAKYIEMLSKYPPDLIKLSGDTVMKTHKWNNFPKVAEFIEVMAHKYSLRQHALKHTMRAMQTHGVATESGPNVSRPQAGRGPRHLGATLPDINKKG